MAVSKIILNTALVLEVSGGVTESGNEIWRKKSFQGVKSAAIPEDIYAVATAITDVLGVETRGFHLAQKILLEPQNQES